jgi:Caudovirus prohead serine protease
MSRRLTFMDWVVVLALLLLLWPAQIRERLGREWNPRRLSEQTVTEALLREVSIVAFPAYMNATAQIVQATA